MLLFFTKFYLSHKYMTLFLYMVLKHKVHKALINIIQLFLHFVKQTCAKTKNGRFYPSAVNVLNLIADTAKKVKSVGDLKSPLHAANLQTLCRSYSVMRFLSFIFIHIFIGDVHYIVEPEVFHRCYCCTDAY